MVTGTIKKTYSTIAILVSIVISGCTLSPAYHKPAAMIPDTWNHQEMPINTQVKDPKSTVFFSDDKLLQLIKLTEKNNPDLAIAALNLQKVGVQYGVERLSYLPAINMTAEKTAAHQPAGIFDTVDTGAVTYQQYDVKLVTASWEVDFWGRLRSLREASMHEYLSAGASTRALKITLVQQTVSAYLNYLTAKESADIAKATLRNLEQIRFMKSKEYQAGALSKSDELAAQKNVDIAQSELSQAKLQAQKDYNTLESLVGTSIPSTLLTDVSIEKDWKFPVLQAGIPSQSLLNRPDIIAAEYKLKSANANIGAARAAFFPTISITAEGGSSTSDMSKLLSGGTASWNFIPTITVPIFNSGRNKASLNLADLNKEIEVIKYQQAIAQAFRDVSDALAGQSTLKDQYAIARRQYAIALKQNEMAGESYVAGKLSNEQVIIMNNEKLTSRRQMLNARLNYLTQGIILYSSLGGDKAI